MKQQYYKASSQQNVPEMRDAKRVKKIQVFVESNIEFAIEVPDDPFYTCGWLQAEVARKYYEVLERQAYEM